MTVANFGTIFGVYQNNAWRFDCEIFFDTTGNWYDFGLVTDIGDMLR